MEYWNLNPTFCFLENLDNVSRNMEKNVEEQMAAKSAV